MQSCSEGRDSRLGRAARVARQVGKAGGAPVRVACKGTGFGESKHLDPAFVRSGGASVVARSPSVGVRSPSGGVRWGAGDSSRGGEVGLLLGGEIEIRVARE